MRAMLVRISPEECTFVTLPPCTHSQVMYAPLPTTTRPTKAAAALRRTPSRTRACARVRVCSRTASVIAAR